jgi:hypothetical protein
VGAVGLSACSVWLLKHSRCLGNSDIDNWIKDAKKSMSGFWKEHVEMPGWRLRRDRLQSAALFCAAERLDKNVYRLAFFCFT